ncbi:STAS domain-containing protein [Geodermatophilus nigrescens]
MTTASGERRIPFPRYQVWRALTAPLAYCPVCDVSYVFSGTVEEDGAERIGQGTQFVCVGGRLEGAPPPPGAVRGEVVEYRARRRIGTRLQRPQETWHTVFELADGGPGATDVAVTVTHEATGGGRIMRALLRRSLEKMMGRTVDAELAKLPDHVRQVNEDPLLSSAIDDEPDGPVLHLRSEVTAAVVRRLQRAGDLAQLGVVAVDVTRLTFIDATAFPMLKRWARALTRSGRPALVRGDNPYFDEMLGVMALREEFRREE